MKPYWGPRYPRGGGPFRSRSGRGGRCGKGWQGRGLGFTRFIGVYRAGKGLWGFYFRVYKVWRVYRAYRAFRVSILGFFIALKACVASFPSKRAFRLDAIHWPFLSKPECQVISYWGLVWWFGVGLRPPTPPHLHIHIHIHIRPGLLWVGCRPPPPPTPWPCSANSWFVVEELRSLRICETSCFDGPLPYKTLSPIPYTNLILPWFSGMNSRMGLLRAWWSVRSKGALGQTSVASQLAPGLHCTTHMCVHKRRGKLAAAALRGACCATNLKSSPP